MLHQQTSHDIRLVMPLSLSPLSLLQSSTSSVQWKATLFRTSLRISKTTNNTELNLSRLVLFTFLLISIHNIFHYVEATSNIPETCFSFAMPLTLKGKKFFKNSDGAYIPLKGVNYYPRPNAGEYVISNSVDFYSADYQNVWARDIENFKKLNINAVRIYAVNPGLNHDLFMCALKQAGMYAIIGLAADCLDCAITPYEAPTCYPEALKTRGEFIIKTFSKYDNVIGFDAGNEISLAAGSEMINGPCQKQFIRDMRAYVDRCSSANMMRHIPIGLAAADVDRSIKALYYNCRSDPTDELENAEYLGMNVYLHCTGNLQSIDQIVGFTTLLNDFTSFQLNIPVLLTEYGCISETFPTIDTYNAQRDWLQVDALFSPSYTEEFAGGFVFEYNTELVNSVAPYPFQNYGPGNFGIGYFSPINCDITNVTCTYIPMPQFDILASRYAAVDMNIGPTVDTYVPPDRPFPQCPAGFPLLSDFVWPNPEPTECPEDLTVTCPDMPWECNTPTHPKPTSPVPSTALLSPSSLSSPVSIPVSTPVSISSPTSNTTVFTVAPVKVPMTGLPTIANEKNVTTPSDIPSSIFSNSPSSAAITSTTMSTNSYQTLVPTMSYSITPTMFTTSSSSLQASKIQEKSGDLTKPTASLSNIRQPTPVATSFAYHVHQEYTGIRTTVVASIVTFIIVSVSSIV